MWLFVRVTAEVISLNWFVSELVYGIEKQLSRRKGGQTGSIYEQY